MLLNIDQTNKMSASAKEGLRVLTTHKSMRNCIIMMVQ